MSSIAPCAPSKITFLPSSRASFISTEVSQMYFPMESPQPFIFWNSDSVVHWQGSASIMSSRSFLYGMMKSIFSLSRSSS